MDLYSISGFLAQAAPQGSQQGWTQLVLFAPMIIIIVVMFMSQGKKAKQHAQMLKTLKAGDKVLMSSGIIGTIITVREKTVTVRSAEAKVEFSKSAVAEITERGADKPESKIEA